MMGVERPKRRHPTAPTQWVEFPCDGYYPCTGTICLENPTTEEQQCPVPEPTAALLYACALATLALLRRQARSR